MSEKFTSLLAACAATLVVFGATSPAAAKDQPIVVTATTPEEEVPVRLVSYRDLDLAKLDDEKMLVKRVRHAAKDVCVESVSDGLYYQRAFSVCRFNALRGARPQIDLAVKRAREIAAIGSSAIAPVAITISAS